MTQKYSTITCKMLYVCECARVCECACACVCVHVHSVKIMRLFAFVVDGDSGC